MFCKYILDLFLFIINYKLFNPKDWNMTAVWFRLIYKNFSLFFSCIHNNTSSRTAVLLLLSWTWSYPVIWRLTRDVQELMQLTWVFQPIETCPLVHLGCKTQQKYVTRLKRKKKEKAIFPEHAMAVVCIPFKCGVVYIHIAVWYGNFSGTPESFHSSRKTRCTAFRFKPSLPSARHRPSFAFVPPTVRSTTYNLHQLPSWTANFWFKLG